MFPSPSGKLDAFFRFLPALAARWLALALIKFCYRIRIRGASSIPSRGAALLVSNHVSYVDALLIGYCVRRPVRFVMIRAIYENRWLNWFFRIMRVIPISTDESPKKILASLRAARSALDAGELVGIFPEGKISVAGLPDDFRPGMEYILRDSAHPVIPVYLGGVYGSVFSRFKTPPFRRMPARFPYPVAVHFGSPLPPDTPATVVRDAIIALSRTFLEEERAKGSPLPEHIRAVDTLAPAPPSDPSSHATRDA